MAERGPLEDLTLRDPEGADSRREALAALAETRGAWEAGHPDVGRDVRIRRLRNRLLAYYLTGERGWR